MDRLRCLQVFAEVARAGSFVRAANKLALSKATVSKHIASLEEGIGARLLNRTNKQVTLTEVGLRVLETAVDLLERYEGMESDARHLVGAPRGAIRLGTPPSFGAHHLTNVVAQFTAHYPGIEITVVLDDGGADLVAEALDLSLRIAPSLADASYVAHPLMRAPQILVAAPAYLREHGTPRTPKELARHNCLIHTNKAGTGIWRFEGGPPMDVRVRGTLRSNMGDVLKQAALRGVGISMHPTYMVARDLDSGQLRQVLPAYVPQELDISVVFSTRRNMPARVRLLLEFLKEWARQPPEWSEAERAILATRSGGKKAAAPASDRDRA